MTAILLPFLFALALTLFAVKRGYFRFPLESGTFPVTFLAMGGAFLVYIGVTLIYFPLVFHFQKSSPWFNLAYLFIIALLLVGYLSIIKRQTTFVILWGGFPPTKKNFWRAIWIGVVSWVISYPYVLTVNGLVKWLVPEERGDQIAVKFLKSTLQNPPLLIVTLLVVIVVVPFVEELLFRGFLQTWLRRFCNRFWALFLTALIFAGVHYSPGQSNLEILFSLFVLACFLGFLYEKERMLWAPLALHMTFNAVSSILILLH